MMSGNATERRGFKQPVTQQHAKQRRLASTLEIRKARKHSRLTARRATMGSQQQHGTMPLLLPSRSDSVHDSPECSHEIIHRCMKTFRQWYIPGQNQPLTSQPRHQVLSAMQELRRLLSVDDEKTPVQAIVNVGALAYMALCLAYDVHPQLQYEAAWALTNISYCSIHKQQVFQEPGVVDHAVRLLRSSPVDDVRKQCAWLLAHLAGDCLTNRNALLANPALRQGLLQNLQQPESLDLLKRMAWLSNNLTSSRPPPCGDHSDFLIVPTTNILKKAVANKEMRDADLLSDSLDVLANLSLEDESSEGRIDAVMQHATPTLLKGIMAVELEGSNKKSIMIPALRTLGNFVSGTETQTQAVLDSGLLELALNVMEHPSKVVQKELCWLLSNVCAGTYDQIMCIFSHGLDGPIIEMAMSSYWPIRREAIWAVCHVCIHGCDTMRTCLASKDALEALSRILSSTAADKSILLGVLDALDHLLKLHEERGGLNIPVLLEQAGGIDNLEALQEHADDDVYEKAKDIIEKFLGGEDGDVDAENEDPSAYLNNDGKFALKHPTGKLLFGNDLKHSSS